MKAIINEKGSGTKEIAIGLLVILGVTAFGVNSILNNTSDDDYKKMKVQADKFVSAVTIHKDMYTNETGIYYLEEIEEYNTESEVVVANPKNKNESCDLYESYVEISNPKKVRLRCGSLLIEGEYQKRYEVYEIGEWQKEDKTGETAFLYNYAKGGKDVLEEPVDEKQFIALYNKEEGTSYDDINDVKADSVSKGYVVDYDMFYRTKKLVKEL